MDFWDMIDSILVAGIKPVVAHPERYRYMQMKDYKRLVDMGAELQLNLPSIIGVYGDNVSRKAEAILDKGWYSMVGTDCHRFRALESQLSCNLAGRQYAIVPNYPMPGRHFSITLKASFPFL